MLKSVKFIAFFLLLLSFTTSQAQDKTLDSIKVAFQNQKIHDTLKMRYLGNLLQTQYN